MEKILRVASDIAGYVPETDRRLQICWAERESRRISRDWIGFPDGWG